MGPENFFFFYFDVVLFFFFRMECSQTENGWMDGWILYYLLYRTIPETMTFSRFDESSKRDTK
jgi:hypothetical protein